MSRRAAIDAKIAERIEVTDCGYETDCHIWTGPTSGDGRGGGYPRMCLDGQTVAVHIVVFTNVHGYVPGKKQIDHKCRNRLCVNPDHLEMVTHLQNQKRRAAAQRELRSFLEDDRQAAE